MRTFDIFSHRSGTYKAIKRGWSWPAFFFCWLWSLFSGFWIAAILAFIVEMLLNIFADVISRESYDAAEPAVIVVATVIVVIALGIRLLFGAKGNAWRRAKLKRKGYSLIQSVQAEGPKAAILSIKDAQS